MDSVRPTNVEPRGQYRIWLRYSDSSEGEVDLAHLAGDGVFKAWDDPACFASVYLTEYDAIAWGDELELCPDALYMELTRKSLAEFMPEAALILNDACPKARVTRPNRATGMMADPCMSPALAFENDANGPL